MRTAEKARDVEAQALHGPFRRVIDEEDQLDAPTRRRKTPQRSGRAAPLPSPGKELAVTQITRRDFMKAGAGALGVIAVGCGGSGQSAAPPIQTADSLVFPQGFAWGAEPYILVNDNSTWRGCAQRDYEGGAEN